MQDRLGFLTACSQEVYISAPTRVVPFWLEFKGNRHVSVICTVPCSVAKKPVHCICYYFSLGAWLLVGDRVHRAHSVFCGP